MAKQAILAAEDELELDFTAGADEPEESEEALDMNFGFGEDETPEDDEPETDAEDGDESDEGDDDGEAEETEESDDDEGAETDPEEEEGEPDEGGEDNTPEAEGDKEGEEEEREDEGAPKAKKSGHMIPKARFDQVLSKNKALEARIAALTAKSDKEGEPEETEAYDFDTKEAEYQDLILDGDTKKAAELRREIRQAERAEIMKEVTKSTTESSTQDRVQDALQDAAQEWYEAYPPLDPSNADFDKELTADIVRVRNGLIASGSNAVDALNEAVELQLARRGLIEPEGTTEAKPKPKPAKKRKKSSVAAKLKAQRSQPAEQGGEGAATRASEDEIDLDKLSDEEFDALPAKTLARLRGDIL